jgi:hypothetical protein
MKKRIQRRHGLLTWVSLAARPRHFFPTPFDSVSGVSDHLGSIKRVGLQNN